MPGEKIAVVIPAYRAAAHIRGVLADIPGEIDHIIVVDDACPQSTGREAEALGRPNVEVIYHERNTGVGGATMTGYRQALALGCDVVVKMDADGQMDPAYIDGLVAPLLRGDADYTKGNRFSDFGKLRAMPLARLVGNSLLSFVVKAASGYWDIIDPTNGYTAIHRRALQKLNFHRLSKRYFFESDMLINLNIAGAVVKDVGIPARYGNEESSIRAGEIVFQFPPKLLKGLLRRIALRYFVYDFNMASVYMILGVPLLSFGLGFGLLKWLDAVSSGTPAPLGTIMLAALPIIVGLEMLLQAVNIDINSVPKRHK